jgi:predicted metal-dependent phosphoesterase TrpH
MQPVSQITSRWKDAAAAGRYRTGVSLHSHTSASEESLKFVHMFLAVLPGTGQVLRRYERMCERDYGLRLDFSRAFWRPPLLPKMAYDLEASQILQMGLYPLVSITDHDTIEAPMLLRAVPSARHIPVSVEWSAPFGDTEFHLGIHNIPSADGPEWMRRFLEFTREAESARERRASTAEHDARLLAMVHELSAVPGVLVVFNHPVWDLHRVGEAVHRREVMRFLAAIGDSIHALELNGLRHAKENREVMRLARETGYLLISGGDRHGLEPNANINLTDARNFREFVDEVRLERRSHVMFMEQYAKPWEGRILLSTLNAVTDFPEFIEGWQRWDERAFHPDAEGNLQPLSKLWVEGRAPWPLRLAIELVRLGRSEILTRTFSRAVRVSDSMPLEMERP